MSMFTKFAAAVIKKATSIASKSFGLAYREAKTAKEAGASASDVKDKFGKGMRKQMDTVEAAQILNFKLEVNQETGEKTPPDFKEVYESYDRLFKANDDTKGGSFYLQSKVHNAYEAVKIDFPNEFATFEKQRLREEKIKAHEADSDIEKEAAEADAKQEEKK